VEDWTVRSHCPPAAAADDDDGDSTAAAWSPAPATPPSRRGGARALTRARELGLAGYHRARHVASHATAIHARRLSELGSLNIPHMGNAAAVLPVHNLMRARRRRGLSALSAPSAPAALLLAGSRGGSGFVQLCRLESEGGAGACAHISVADSMRQHGDGFSYWGVGYANVEEIRRAAVVPRSAHVAMRLPGWGGEDEEEEEEEEEEGEEAAAAAAAGDFVDDDDDDGRYPGYDPSKRWPAVMTACLGSTNGGGGGVNIDLPGCVGPGVSLKPSPETSVFDAAVSPLTGRVIAGTSRGVFAWTRGDHRGGGPSLPTGWRQETYKGCGSDVTAVAADVYWWNDSSDIGGGGSCSSSAAAGRAEVLAAGLRNGRVVCSFE
jgi:hypothetical protein